MDKTSATKNNFTRILHIMSGYGGGISSFIKNKAEQMKPFNIIFDVVTYDECPADFEAAIKNTGGNIYKLANPKKQGWPAFRTSYTSILAKFTYDIIYCHISGYRTIPYHFYAQRYGIKKFYIHAHSAKRIDNLSAPQQWAEYANRLINRKLSDAYVGCGVKACKAVFGENINTNDIMVIPNSIDNESFVKDQQEFDRLRSSYRQQLNLSADELVIGQIGRLKSVKNHDFTIQLAKFMKENTKEGKILFVGEGDRELELKETIKTMALDGIICFTGRISPISEFYPALDMVLLPSHFEGLPTVVVEAQATGVPVLMSDTITREVDLGLGMVAYLALNDDLSNWYDTLIDLHQRDIPLAELRSEQIIAKKFSNEASAELYAKFLFGEISSYQIN